MVKVKIGVRKYKLPKRYTLEQWKEIQKCDPHEYRGWAQIMAIALGIPLHKVLLCEEEGLRLGAALVLSQVHAKVRECKIYDFTQFNFGQFIDLDVYLVGGIEKNWDAILKMLSPKKIIYIDEALWLLEQYKNFRLSTYRQYSGLFGLNDYFEEDEESVEIQNPNKVAKGWYSLLVDLANDDVLKLDAITELPLKTALNFMSLRKERAEEENIKQINQKRQYDLQRRNK